MARPVEKRAHIERAVVEVVAAHGLKGATIQQIANAANVSPGLLYRYWENRDDLAGEVYRAHLTALLGRLASRAASATSVLGRLEIMVRELLAFADEQPIVLKFLLFTQHELGDAVPEGEGVRHFARDIIAAGIADGSLRPLPADVALQLAVGVVLQPIVGAMYGQLATPVSQHADDIIAALERVLAAERVKATGAPPPASSGPGYAENHSSRLSRDKLTVTDAIEG